LPACIINWSNEFFAGISGVWHLAAMPIHLDTAHVMITLPERIYKTDCVVVDYQPEQYVKIEL
jgi:hypothetical protein